MKRKILGILVCMLLILTVISTSVTANETEAEIDIPSDGPSNSIWFVRGIFKYLDEDEEYIYLTALTTKLCGIGNGLVWYHLLNCPIKISKPLYGFYMNDYSIILIGICDHWEYDL